MIHLLLATTWDVSLLAPLQEHGQHHGSFQHSKLISNAFEFTYRNKDERHKKKGIDVNSPHSQPWSVDVLPINISTSPASHPHFHQSPGITITVSVWLFSCASTKAHKGIVRSHFGRIQPGDTLWIIALPTWWMADPGWGLDFCLNGTKACEYSIM